MTIFTATQQEKHKACIATTIIKIVRTSLHYQDIEGPMQIERGKSYSLILLCLKINCINVRIK